MQRKKILVTGANSFTGKELINYLTKRGEFEIIAWTRKEDIKGINTKFIEMKNREEVLEGLNEVSPDYVAHLVGVNRARCYEDYFNANAYTTLHLLDALVKNKLFKTRLLCISSAAVYGENACSLIQETVSAKPINLYGVSKLTMEHIITQYVSNYNLKINIARPFNLISPTQSTQFVVPSFIEQMLSIRNRKDLTAPMKVGNIEMKRDFIDLRDCVDAYWKILTSEKFGQIFNIGSGHSIRISELIQIISQKIGIRPKIVVDETRFVAKQIHDISANTEKIKLLGWNPKYSLDDSLKDIITEMEKLA